MTVQNALMLRDKTAWVVKSSDAWYYVMISNDINTILMTVQSVLMLKNKTAWVMKSSNIWYYICDLKLLHQDDEIIFHNF